MTEFADVPEVNNLYTERQLVDAAIAILDGGGNMTFFTVEQGLPVPGVPVATYPPVRVTMPPPTPPDTKMNLRAWLVQRQTDIDNQLAALGVVNPPVKRV